MDFFIYIYICLLTLITECLLFVAGLFQFKSLIDLYAVHILYLYLLCAALNMADVLSEQINLMARVLKLSRKTFHSCMVLRFFMPGKMVVSFSF